MRLPSFLHRFRRDERGVTAVAFGVSAVPLFLIIAAATDYARIVDFRTKMQSGVDAAAIAMARQPASATDPQLTTRGRPLFDAHAVVAGGYSTSSFTATRSGRTISVAAAGQVQTSFGSILGRPVIDIHADAVVASGSKKIELALVLDNTGSMASRNKMQKLKDASNLLLDKLQAAVMAPGDVKVAVVPFDTGVRMPTATVSAPPTWIRFDPASGVRASNWQGCVADRGPSPTPYDVSDRAPVLSITESLFLATQCSSSTLARLLPLTTDFAAVRSTIRSMQPSGCTNVTIGAVWGLHALSDTDPVTGAVPLGDPDVQKIMVILTDGLNTRNRWIYDPAGCGGGPGVVAGSASAIDARTELACTNVLGAATADTRIRTYAIRVIEGNETLLRGCAGNGGKYYNVADPNDLDAVFQSIADEITRIRLTS